MAKLPGIPLIKNWINNKKSRLETTGLRPAKVSKPRQTFLSSEDSTEEGLEDTPDVSAELCPTSVMPSEASAAPEKRLKPAAKPEKKQKHKKTNKRKPTVLAGAFKITHSRLSPPIFSAKSSKGNAAAMVFAQNRKRLGKKGRRNRRIFVFAGSGIAVALIMLLVFLVPGNAAAPVSGQTAGVSSAISGSGNPAWPVAFEDSTPANESADGAETPSPTLPPSPSPTLIPTTAPDPSEEAIDVNELVKYFVVDADKYYNEYHYSNNHYEYTDGDITMLAQVIYGEARGENTTGKIAVANVVMNRVLSRKFGGSLAAVITAPSQFTGYRSSISPSRSCINAARQVLINEVWVIPQDIYYFRPGAQEDANWNGHAFYKKIDHHCFYRGSVSTRRRNAGVPEALYKRIYKYPQYGCLPEDRVYRVQFMLDALGYKIEKVDRYFGQGSKKAMIKFQQDHGLDDDGVAGPTTLKRLIEEYGTRKYVEKFCK